MIDKVLSLLLSSTVTLHPAPDYCADNCHLYDCKEGGYVITLDEIISSQSPIVMGYSKKGDLGAALSNPNFKHWLQSCCDYVDYLKNDLGYTDQQLRDLWTAKADDGLAEVEPLCHTQWGQLAPFNIYCPLDSEGTRCYTGCVATAMAQMMYYHKWPDAPVGTGAYFDPLTGQQYVPLDDFTFNWNAMLLSYNGPSLNSSKEAVARLMWACGLSINSQYTGYGTSAYVCRVAHGLIENMDYSRSVRYLRRDYCSSGQWISILRSELEAGRPVIFGGQSRIDGGHCFVVDGIDSQNYLHVNWGWYGESDGYFNVNYMFPVENAKSGFVFTQEAVIGIQRPAENENSLYFDQPLSLHGGLSFSNSNPTRRGTFSVVFNDIKNFTGYDFSGSIGLALYRDDSRLEVLKSSALSLDELKSIEKKTFMLSIPAEYPEGNYELRPVSKCDLNSDWVDMLCPVNTTGRIWLEVGADRLNLSTTQYSDSVSWTGLTFDESDVISISEVAVQVNPATLLPVNLVLHNSGNAPYEGQVGLALVNEAGQGQWSATTSVIVYPGESHSVGFECAVPAVEGTYYFKAAHLNPDDNSTVFYEPASDIVTTLLVQSFEPDLEVSEVLPDRILPGELYKVNATVTNRTDATISRFQLTYDVDGGEATTKTYEKMLTAGASTTIYLSIGGMKEVGRHHFNYAISSIDGCDDIHPENSSSSVPVLVRGTRFDQMVVAEEFTGLWCGYCPRGLVCMERMKEAYPDSFIAMAVHYNDVLEPIGYDEVLSTNISTYPSAWINRAATGVGDASFADVEGAFELAREAEADALLTLSEVKFTTPDATEISVSTQARFGYPDTSASYQLAFVLLEDSVSTDSSGNPLMQANYYANGHQEMGGWESLESMVKVTLSDVVRQFYGDSYDGLAGSLPEAVAPEVTYDSGFTLSVPSSVLSVSRLRLVALLIDAETHQVLNAAVQPVSPASDQSIQILTSDEVPTETYDLFGNRVSTMERGRFFICNGKPVIFK